MTRIGDLARKPGQPKLKSYEKIDVSTYDGFGKPWVVLPRAAFLWDRLDGGVTTAFAKKGDIVGEKLRIQKPDGLRIRLPRTSSDLYDAQWACPAHEQCGVVLEEVDEHEGISLDSCFISSRFRKIYTDVIDLCYKRIYEDNFDTLWSGDRGRMPSKAVVETKLFQPSSLVLHATVGPRATFQGGAIVHCVRVPVMSLGRGKMGTVTYVDCCASVYGSHAGRAIWEAITSLPADLVALHSIPLESTLSFWSACGMRLINPNDKQDEQRLAEELFTKSSGMVSSMRVKALVDALPSSQLPLLICCLGTGSLASDDPEVAIWAPEDVAEELLLLEC